MTKRSTSQIVRKVVIDLLLNSVEGYVLKKDQDFFVRLLIIVK